MELEREAIEPLISTRGQRIGGKANGVSMRRIKTKWRSCNSTAKTILLNTDLAKKARECLENIVVHEPVHLLEPIYNDRFLMLKDQYMPKCQSHRQLLNSLAVRHDNWG